MKHHLVILPALLITLLLLGCKKNIPVPDSLQGTWELRIDVNGLSGHATYHKAGNDTLMKFTDNRYESYEKGKLIRSGTYQVKRDTFHIINTIKYRIIYDNNDDMTHQFFDIENNQLSFFLDAYDAPSVIYERIK